MLFNAAVIGWSLLFTVSVWAGPRTKDALSTELKGQAFQAKLKPGFHFNEKAPNAVHVEGQVIKASSLSNQEAQFSGLPEKWSSARAMLYICDDAVTFCETQIVELKGSVATKAQAHAGKKASKPEPTGRVNKYGFIEDDFKKALTQAKKENKLILIDFSARWCPGCVRLEDEIFATKEFKALTKNVVKLKIDVDKFENSVISNKFDVALLPTMLVINSDQEEIDRILDFQPQEVFNQFFAAINDDPTSLQKLMAKAAKGDSATRLRLGKRLLAAQRFEEAQTVLAGVKPSPPELLTAQVGAAAHKHRSGEADEKSSSAYAKALREALRTEPASARSLAWRAKLVDVSTQESERKTLKKEGAQLADKLLADKKQMAEALKTDAVGEFTGFEPFLIALYRAELATAGEVSDKEKEAAWREAAAVVKELKIPVSKVGVSLRHLIVLNAAKMYDEADRLTLALLKHDPGNPEVQRRRLKVLVEQERYPEAIRTGRKALEKSYGRNEFWVAELLAKALVQAKQADQARQLVNAYLARNEIEWPNMKSSKKALEELRASIPKS